MKAANAARVLFYVALLVAMVWAYSEHGWPGVLAALVLAPLAGAAVYVVSTLVVGLVVLPGVTIGLPIAAFMAVGLLAYTVLR